MANQSPPANSYCGTLPDAETPPIINFFGGLKLVAQVDPTKGAPGQCELSLDLIGKMEAALAPLAPILLILDVVAQLISCFTLATDAISNPLKIPDLLACFPDLVTKFNQLLGLVPTFPQGIVNIAAMVYSTVGLTRYQIGCAIVAVKSIQSQLAEVNSLLARAQEVNDSRMKTNLTALAACARQNAQRQAGNVLAALGPITRILCTVRALLVIIPGGRPIAKKLTLDLPTSLDQIDDALAALEATKEILDEVLALIEDLVNSLGLGALLHPDPVFRCPVDDLPTEEPSTQPVARPAISGVVPVSGPFGAPGRGGNAPVPADVVLVISGSGFNPNAVAYLGTSKLATTFQNPSRVTARVPAAQFKQAATYQLIAVNESPNSELFGGSPSPAQPTGNPASKASDVYDYEVT